MSCDQREARGWARRHPRGYTRGNDGGRPTKASFCSEFLAQIRMHSTLHHASVRSCGVETEGDDLVPDARFVHLFRTTAGQPFSASRKSELCRGPQKESGVILPCEERGAGPPYSPERGREEFSVPMQGPTSQGILPGSAASTIFSAACSPRNSRRWVTVLFGPLILPNGPIP
ncbi:hypothetical protein GWK47_027658 [Chionoecetes opilio]|uniref:Uncharacterized protein n=1 Tax=Chionoecetes opilio TaxID=41210 RepID=A0A8J8WDZ1_CHIOP|nr:hypothetical protein GWK47_027658 [Chionoecetes opilio]